MAKSWSIEILDGPNGTVVFRPDGEEIGKTLGAKQGDNVTWTNRTNRPLELHSIDPLGLYLTDEIPAGSASSPAFDVTQDPGTTITYSCVAPDQQQHSIVVKP